MARMVDQLQNTVPDRTNAPYNPDAAETSHEWAARVGQEHDTWHKPDDGVTAPRPVITSVDPNPVTIGASVTLRVLGSGFVEGAVVKIPTVFVGPTTFVSDTELTVEHTVQATPGLRSVLVQNPDGQFSNYVDLVIDEGMYPVITGFSPDPMQIPLAGGYVPLTIIGTGFVDANPKVDAGPYLFDGNFVSETEISCAGFEPSKLGPGITPVQVKLGVATYSNYGSLTILGPPGPTIASVVPNGASQAAGVVTVVVTGANFVSGSIVRVAGDIGEQPTTFVSATELTAQIDPALGTPGTSSALSVLNPDGNASPGVAFNISA
jgi:hypothetical protein